jgi:hypothetical protein
MGGVRDEQRHGRQRQATTEPATAGRLWPSKGCRGALEFSGSEENTAVPSPARRERVAEGRVRALAIAPLTPTLSPRKDGGSGRARKRWRTPKIPAVGWADGRGGGVSKG